ncbi:DUF3616 domain-containing protein [Mesorhizobium sp. M0296]|uniref:DUF3616 domain-containing protein n=1 Tax=Mesorhizobium sp. M0296 TaxID=2956931 RepID=UPI00333B1F79
MSFNKKPFSFSSAVIAIVLFLAPDSHLIAAEIAPVKGPLPAANALPFDKDIRRAISGIACVPEAIPSHCLLALDEGAATLLIELKDGAIAASGEPLSVLSDGDELDAEGVAKDQTYFYLLGSHTRKRKNCDENAASHNLVRIPYQTGKDGLAILADGAGAATIKKIDLSDIVAANPKIGPYFDKCLGDPNNGVDIEGLAVRDSDLYLGLRGPLAADGSAYVLTVPLAGLFEDKKEQARLTVLQLGSRGIRDLASVDGGMLVLGGPGDNPSDSGWTVSFWDGSVEGDGQGEVTTLANLNLSSVSRGKQFGCKDKEIKPEGMAVIGATGSAYRILIVSDGMCDGGPMVFEIPKAAH